MRIVYCGSGEFGIPCLEAINASEHNLVRIFTQPPHPAGRGRKPKPTPVASWAEENKVSFQSAEDINSPDMLEKIANCKPDLLVVIAFGQKISDELIKLPSKAAINVHASLLPKYRGAAPINWAIINGETETGVSIITLASKMDAGDILAQAKTSVYPADTAQSLRGRLAKLAGPILVETIDKIQADTVVYKKQDDSLATKAPKLKKTDGFIDFNASAESINNRIRGLWPWPGAQTLYISKKTQKSCRVIIVEAEPIPSATTKTVTPGTIDDNLNVICSEGTLKIIRLKPAGSAAMDCKAFANGRATAAGDMFMKISQ